MKGNPFREFCFVLLAGILLGIPLWILTSGTPIRPVQAAEEPDESTYAQEAWLELRFSHPPESVEVFQNQRLLWQGGGDLRDDTDVQVEMSDPVSPLILQVLWTEDVDQAYAEFRLELDAVPAHTIGFWGSGTVQRTWNLQGDAQP
jgi:hypothetical protein